MSHSFEYLVKELKGFRSYLTICEPVFKEHNLQCTTDDIQLGKNTPSWLEPGQIWKRHEGEPDISVYAKEWNGSWWVLVEERQPQFDDEGNADFVSWSELQRDVLAEGGPAMRGQVLREAIDVINGERQDQYGNPEDSFVLIADLWAAYLDRVVEPQDVAAMMVLLKLARQRHQFKRDNYVDMAGYTGIMADLAEKETNRSVTGKKGIQVS